MRASFYEVLPGLANYRECASVESPAAGFECDVPALPPGRRLVFRVEFLRSLAIRALGRPFTTRFTLGCKNLAAEVPFERDCANNLSVVQRLFVLSGDSEVTRADAVQIRGFLKAREAPSRRRPLVPARLTEPWTAAVAPRDRPRRAEVALLRLGRGQLGFSGAATPLPEGEGGEGACSWLANRRGRFQAMPLGARRSCDAPIWLRARGRGRWSFRLAKPLPAGRYVVYSRAVTRAGAVEQSFTRADDNRVEFPVRRRR